MTQFISWERPRLPRNVVLYKIVLYFNKWFATLALTPRTCFALTLCSAHYKYPQSFPGHSPVIPRSFPGHSPVIPRSFPGHSPVIPFPSLFPSPFPVLKIAGVLLFEKGVLLFEKGVLLFEKGVCYLKRVFCYLKREFWYLKREFCYLKREFWAIFKTGNGGRERGREQGRE